MKRKKLRIESPPDLDLTSRARRKNADQRLTKVSRVQGADKPRSHDHQGGNQGGRGYQPAAEDRMIHGQLNAQSRAPLMKMCLLLS